MTVRVANRRHTGAGHYVGRPTPLGNPFKVGRDGSRREVVRKYREWFIDKLDSGDQEFDGALEKLGKAHAEGDITLLCWCAPSRCHADVIAEFIESEYPASEEGCTCHCHD